jgi:hypothetical protein
MAPGLRLKAALFSGVHRTAGEATDISRRCFLGLPDSTVRVALAAKECANPRGEKLASRRFWQGPESSAVRKTMWQRFFQINRPLDVAVWEETFSPKVR